MKKNKVKKSGNLRNLLIVLILLIAIFGITTKGNFFRMANIRSILNAMTLVIFLAIGASFLMIYGGIDLSAGNVGTFAACVMTTLVVYNGLPSWIGYFLAIAIGAAMGLCNAFMVQELKFQPFIATMAMSSVAQGFTYVVTKGINITVKDNLITFLGTKKIFGNAIPFSMLIALIFLLVYGILLSRSKFGRKIYLCGGNRQAARLAGINSKKLGYIMFANSGALAAIAGSLAMSRMKEASVSGIGGLQFNGITAAMLGGISFGGGSGNMLGCFVGMLILNTFNNGMNLLGINSYVQTVFSGVLLLIALTIDNLNKAREAKQLVAKMEAEAAAEPAAE